VAELALNDHERHPFTGELDSVRATLMRSETAADASDRRGVAQLCASRRE
jgi:hypothetical protein